MDFTFGICVGPGLDAAQYNHLMESIAVQNVPNHEIILVGTWNNNYSDWAHTFVEFDGMLNGKSHITAKKNIIAQEAKYENIVFMHDYYVLDGGWHNAWKNFDVPFDVATNQIRIMDDFGPRHSDWTIDPFVLWELYPALHGNFWEVALPYEYRGLTKLQYISGGYWVAKKKFMLENPLDETLAWGDAEDIEWSKRIREKTEFQLNSNATVWVTKRNKWKPGLIPDTYLQALLNKHNLQVHHDNNHFIRP